ncbi:MAG TPA: RluA family pseudouridine synthase [Candidatus Paceibacterota bacterium]|nr:RluA family pseudouridine synthase [Candidatus Paceibacterota bacterium]
MRTNNSVFVVVYQEMPEILIIYEDADVLVVNKPAGLTVHADGFSGEPTLVDWLLDNRPEIKGIGEAMTLPSGQIIDRPGIVHRLDRDTSGCMIVAKTQEAFVSLKEQFQGRQVQKSYRALVYGDIKTDKGIIDFPIGRSRKDPRMRSAHKGASGKLREALTHYKVLERFDGYSYLEAFPKTGRTHQIRVHLKAIHHPIVCDALYAPGRSCLPGMDRQALHAFRLEAVLPSGRREAFEAPLPDDFQTALDHLKSAC